MINFRKYLRQIDRQFSNGGLVQEHPEKPFKVRKNPKTGEILIDAHRHRVRFRDDHSITYSERGMVDNQNYTINSHSYHFQPLKNSGMHPFRIDLSHGELHANDYDGTFGKFDETWPDHLTYPTDIQLNITDFNLALALNTSFFYISSQEYPLVDTSATRYNRSNGRMRRHLNG